jgi:hypothetical protein
MMLVSTMLRSLSTSSGILRSRPAVYASPLAFEWRPKAPAGQTQTLAPLNWLSRSGHSRIQRADFGICCAAALSPLKPHSTPSRCPVDRQVFDCLYWHHAGINLHLKDYS